jgi:hypothetical protein
MRSPLTATLAPIGWRASLENESDFQDSGHHASGDGAGLLVAEIRGSCEADDSSMERTVGTLNEYWLQALQ